MKILVAMLVVITTMALWALLNRSPAQNPCDRSPTWQISPPRVGHPSDLQYPRACITIDGMERCQ